VAQFLAAHVARSVEAYLFAAELSI